MPTPLYIKIASKVDLSIIDASHGTVLHVYYSQFKHDSIDLLKVRDLLRIRVQWLIIT